MPDHSNVQLVDGVWVALPVEPTKAEWPFAWMRAEPGTMLAKLRERVDADNYDLRFTPDEVREAIDEFLQVNPDADFGPGHIVLSDHNLETHWIASCVRGCLEGGRDYGIADRPEGQDREVAHFLAALLELEEDGERCDFDEDVSIDEEA